MENLNWDDIRYFLAVVEAGSLTSAARQLRVEHTTVSRRIEALEKSLELRLFDRLPRQWQLTAEGENLIPGARRLEEEVLSLRRTAAGVAPLSGTVRISVPPVIASYLLVPQLGPLRAKLPGICLEVVGEIRDANLFRREADIALRMPRPEASGLAARPLIEVGFGLYANRHYLTQHEAADWTYVGYEDSLIEMPQQQWLEKAAAGRPFTFRSNDLNILLQAVRSGLGVGVLPHFLAHNDPLLIPISSPACPVKRTLWLVMHPDVRLSPRVRAVADELVEIFAREATILI
ncbi:MAG TPA: LysR family transcriptional regulator [Pseudomonadales bacterium]|nr:LysR family transcriptional regulator [Pseudomonadales bacterium]